jgi:transcriptional regulator with GAF, ATPase, and Fis domain
MGARYSAGGDLAGFALAAGRVVPVGAVGVITRTDNDKISVLRWSVPRLGGHTFVPKDVPAALLPSPARLEPCEVALEEFEASSADSIVPQIVSSSAPRALLLPITGQSSPSIAWIATPNGDPFTVEQIAVLRSLAQSVAVGLDSSEQPETELARLRRVAVVDEMLSPLAGVLDLRDVFKRTSQIAGQVLAHDAITVLLLTGDRTQVVPYAMAGPAASQTPAPHPLPDNARHLLVEPWDFEILDDLQTDPGQPSQLVAPGYRSLLRVPIRRQGQVDGIVAILSRTPARYVLADVAVARRFADHVALALSHQRLAEQARQTEDLRVRTATLELLDELLGGLVDSADLPEIFDRVSAIARKVLPYDAMVLSVVLPDRRHVRVYASTGEGAKLLPEVLKIPDVLVEDPQWEHVLSDDLQEDPVWQHLEAAKRGYRSAIRAAIRLDGELFGAVAFLSFTPAVYKPADLLVARRIRDRLALTMTRGRGVDAARRADEAIARALVLESRVRALTEELNARAGYRRIVGNAPAWRQVLTQATQVAATETTVLLLGESGTGKEVVARFIHRGSSRGAGPFVALNCAALPETLLEAEMFGYERGAFTGATQSKPGQLEQAAGGVLFLDEVGEMSLAAQAKFLRVLEEREFQRLGGTRVLKTDARIIAATNRDLLKAIERGRFREDLYYRLHVFAIHLPPLRDRREDVLVLSEAFVAEIGRSLGRPPAGISREARQVLVDYHWPGNVRELHNVLERAAILCDGGLIAAEHLALRPAATPVVSAPSASGSEISAPERTGGPGDLRSVERAMIEKALKDARFNKSEAAKALGLTRAQLYVRLRRHGLEGDRT